MENTQYEIDIRILALTKTANKEIHTVQATKNIQLELKKKNYVNMFQASSNI